MDITIQPRLLRGTIAIIPSKSQAHRLLICAAFADKPTQIRCPDTNRDIEATADCLRALGAEILRTGYSVFPVTELPKSAELNCCESGSTLRFLLPVCGALGVDTTFSWKDDFPSGLYPPSGRNWSAWAVACPVLPKIPFGAQESCIPADTKSPEMYPANILRDCFWPFP